LRLLKKDASVIVLEKGEPQVELQIWEWVFCSRDKISENQLVDFSKEDAFNFLMNYTHWRVDARLVRKYIEQSSDTIDWLETMGVEFLGAYKYFEKSTQTWHVRKTKGSNAPAERAASNIVRALTDRAENWESRLCTIQEQRKSRKMKKDMLQELNSPILKVKAN
jgi:fumarate reductase flavoprotein subunit